MSVHASIYAIHILKNDGEKSLTTWMKTEEMAVIPLKTDIVRMNIYREHWFLTYAQCAGVVALLALLLGPVSVDAQDREPASIGVIGDVVPRQSGDVAAAIAAPVTTVLVVAGDTVRAGDPLAMLNIDDRRADLEIARTQIAVAEAQIGARQAALEVERASLRRLDSLKGSAAFNASRLEDSQVETARLSAEIAVARAQFEEARARAARLLVDIERSKVRAPYDAVVISREIDAGDFVTLGRRMFSLVNTRNLEVEADVPTAFLRFLKMGERVEARTRDGRSLIVTVRALIPVENALTETRTVRFSVPSAQSLAVGQAIELRLPQGTDG